MSTAKPHVTDKVIETREIMAVWSKVGISLKLENGARKDVRILSQKKIGNTEHLLPNYPVTWRVARISVHNWPIFVKAGRWNRSRM